MSMGYEHFMVTSTMSLQGKCPLIQALVRDEGHYWSKAGGRACIR